MLMSALYLVVCLVGQASARRSQKFDPGVLEERLCVLLVGIRSSFRNA